MLRPLISFLLVGILLFGQVAPGAFAGPREDFVTGFYVNALGRAPDPAGLPGWSNFLRSHCSSGGVDAMAAGFFDSEEFRTMKPESLKGLVTVLYRTFLGREPDPTGLAGWSDLFRQARLTMALRGFVLSKEFQDLLPDRKDRAAVTALVTRLYREILQRQPDQPGLTGWVDHTVSTGDLEGTATGFLASQEFEGRPLTARDYVTILYRTFLNRDPEPAGLDGWERVLRDTLLQVINSGFVPSTEFKSHVPEVCETFEAALVRCGDVNKPTMLSGCGTDPLSGGEAEVNKKGGNVEIEVVGATPSVSYDVFYRSLSGSTSTELMVGTLATNAMGNGELEVANFFAMNDVGSGNFVLKRAGSVQFVTGFKVVAMEAEVQVGDESKGEEALEPGKFEAALVQCAEVTKPTTLSNCGTDSLSVGMAEINKKGKVQVKVVMAQPNESYKVVYRSLTGSTSTELTVGTLATNPAGNGNLEVENFFALNDVGSGNIVLERVGSDQFVTGFKVE